MSEDEKAANGVERRLFHRYPCAMEITCLQLTGGVKAPLPARLRDVSQGGASLLLWHRVKPGEFLTIRLPTRLTRRRGRGREAHVLRAQRHPSGAWQVGCAFTRRMTDRELQEFLS